MPSKLNTEFNYRYQVQGETPWAKIKTLHGFLEGRKRAADLEKVSEIRTRAKILELEQLKSINALPYIILNTEADILESESYAQTQKEAYELNRQEIIIIEKVLAELYEIAEPTRILGYTDEEMFEENAANEFTVMIGKEIQAEIIANGRPSPAKLHNAMSNPYTWNALKQIGLIPQEAHVLIGNADPRKIELKVLTDQSKIEEK
jgi:hypothetical protein